MALVVQDGVLTWQKVAKAVLGANPATQAAFRDLKNYITTQGKNPQLQFVSFSGASMASDGGAADVVLCSGPCTLYATYLAKAGSVETIYKGSNNATTAATDGTQDHAIAATVAGDVFEIYPKGRALSAGLTVAEDTTRTGSTRTLTANAMSGFVIIGA